ncbi:MAG: ABC transporter substrate-binding protein [Clostridia bacterium]|nr:ABC transporter substrate-binding protein [Clostridia bacterium]
MKRFSFLLVALLMAAVMATPVLAAPKEAPDVFDLSEATNLDADIVIVQALDMVSWDPTNTSDLSNGYVINNVYSKLFTFDRNLNGIPELCESYEMLSENEWHFKIYEGIKVHDGSILTADDVVHSLNRTKNGTAIGALFAPVVEISKVDDLTLRILTSGPYPALPTALTHQSTCIVPQAYAEQAEASGDWSHPIGSGRYTFTSRLIGDSIKLTRFDDYFNQDDKALNNSLTFKVIPEGSSRTIAVETGAADMNVDFSTVDYNRVANDDSVALWQHYSQTVWHLGMNTTLEWFNNPLVRQAVNFAVNRDDCLEVGHNGLGTVVYNCATFAPTCLGAIDNPLDMYSYDPERAKALMAEAGCPGFDTEIIVFRDEAERIAQVVQADLADIGINAQIVRIENAVFASMIAEHKAPMFITSWGAYWDPDLFLARRFGTAGIGGVNRGWYLNEELDELIAEGRASFDNEVRAEVYKRVQEFMAIEAPEVDLYVSIMFAMTNKDLRGVEINVERPFNYYKLHY